MPQHTDTAAATQQYKPALPVCPACGGLECLCRPRFFAGQLLTEEDLNRLDHYIIEKNKLHNRYLHGWGVACGLEVSCNPCEGFVTVKAGYALSPCGNDIVVCRDASVNVCELLRKCRDDRRRHWECDPAWPGSEPECDRAEDWVLYICYDEKPSRGITALRGSSVPACCSNCNCGGLSGCGCGCHEVPGRQMKSSYQPAQKRALLPQCEPTIICEGYTFQVRKVPQVKQENDRGAMFNRIEECLNDLKNIGETISALPSPPSLIALNGIREELLLLLEHHGVQNCELHRQLLQPLALTQPFNMPAVLKYFNDFRTEAIRACFCSALIPPCPDAVDDNCVPLARVTVSCKDGCRIVRVCNWENRRIVPTVPNLEYWLEGFVRTSGIPEFLDTFCCKPIGETPENLQFFKGGGINIGGVNININNLQGAVETFRDHLKRLVKALIT